MSDVKKYINKLSDARVLIIGGTSGIGFTVAEACLESGCSVTVSSSQPSRIDRAVQRLLTSYPSAKNRLTGYACDLGSSDVEANIASLFASVGTVDHIVYTAGNKLAPIGLKDVTLENILKGSQVRHVAPILIAKHATAYLSPGPASSITLTAGTASERPVSRWIVPGAMSAALHSITRALALEMKPVRVNVVSPGAVETELWDGLVPEQRDAFKAKLKEQSTTGEIGQPEDVAEAYLYCMRDRNVTGALIATNSGILLTGN